MTETFLNPRSKAIVDRANSSIDRGHLLPATKLAADENQGNQCDKRECTSDNRLDDVRLDEAALESPLGHKEGCRESEAALDKVKDRNAVHSLGDVRLDDVSLENTTGGGVGDIEDAETTNDLNGPCHLVAEANAEEHQTNNEQYDLRKQRPETVFGHTFAFVRAVRVSADEISDGCVGEKATGEFANHGADSRGEESKTDLDLGKGIRRSRQDLRGHDGETDGPHEDDSVDDRGNNDRQVDNHAERSDDLVEKTDRLFPGVPRSAYATV